MSQRVLIVEDNKYSRIALRSILEGIGSIEIAGELEDGNKVLDFIEKNEVDIIFFDILMPAEDGITLAQKVNEVNDSIYIIFITGHAEYAAKAFDLEVVDFILKPCTEERVKKAIERKKLKKAEKESYEISQLKRLLEVPSKLVIKHNDELIFIEHDKIIFIEKQNRKSLIHTNEEIFETWDNLENLEKRLNSDRFFRVHRSFLVNVNKIKKVVRWSDRTYMIKLSNDKEAYLSRSKAKMLYEIIK